MSDGLKKYIDSNRKELEIYPFDTESGWLEIKGKVAGSHSGFNWMKIAAAATILISMCLSYLIYVNNGFQATGLPSDLTEAKLYYEEMIDTRMILVQNKVDNEKIMEDLKAMDQIFTELSEDLKENVDNEEVLAAMIASYRLKLEILERILSELEEEENEEVINI